MKIQLLLSCCILLCLALTTNAQNIRVAKGTVYDSETNQPLAGASLLHPPSKLGATCGADGSFRMELPDSIDWLEISFLGYNPQRLFLDCDSCEYRIFLVQGIIPLEDLEIYAYNIDRHPYSSIQSIYPNLFNTNNGTSIETMLNTVPGVYMHTGTLNTNRITVRGIGARSPFSTRNIKAYYDDIPIISADGESIMEDLDLNTLDNITIVKGPSGSTFGAPLGGAILLNNGNFGNSNFMSDFSMGSFGLWRNTNRLKLHNTDLLLQLFQSTTHVEGFRDNNHVSRRSFGFNGQYKKKRHSFSFIGNYIFLHGEIPSSLDSANYIDNPRAAAFTWAQTEGHEDYERGMLGLNHKYIHTFDNGFEWDVSNSIFFNSRVNHEVRPFNILEENQENRGWRSLAQLSNEFEKWSLNYSIGTELMFEDYIWKTFENEDFGTEGEQLSDNLENRFYANLFTELELKSERFSVVAGFNANKTNYALEDRFFEDTTDQSGSYAYDWILSPKLGLSYRFKSYYLADLTVYSNVSHGFSMPSVEETLLPDGQINPNLQPEMGWNLEVGTKGNLFDGRIIYDMALYQMRINNLIVIDRPTPDVIVGVNAGKTNHEGLEFSFQYNQTINYTNRLSVAATYTKNNFTFLEFIDDGADFSGNQLTGVPEDILNLSLNWEGGKKLPIYATIKYQFVEGMPMNDENTQFSDAYHLTHIKAGYIRSFSTVTLNFYAGINNVFNEKYASMIAVNAPSFGGRAPRYYYPGLPRNFYTGMKLSVDF